MIDRWLLRLSKVNFVLGLVLAAFGLLNGSVTTLLGGMALIVAGWRYRK